MLIRGAESVLVEGMPVKIVLATDPGKTTDRLPPLGILYVASYLRTVRDDDVKIIDAYATGMSRAEFLVAVAREQPDILGMSSYTHTFDGQMETLRVVKNSLPATRIVLGGYFPSQCWHEILRAYDFVDYVIRGDGEQPFSQLAECLEADVDPRHIPGLAFRKDGQPVANPVEFVRDLDILPFPDRSLVRGNDYSITWQGARLTFGDLTNIQTSRGCPYGCTFCTSTARAPSFWRARSAANVVNELEEVAAQGYENVIVVDYNFTANERRVLRICEGLRKKRIRLRISCEGRVDRASRGLVREMKRAGFVTIFFGGDSASQEVLDLYGKSISPAQTVQAVRNAKSVGLTVFLSFILGAPGETREGILRTLDFAASQRPHALLLPVLEVIQGTPLWREFERQGVLDADAWRRPMFVFDVCDEFNREELSRLVREGYQRYYRAWKSAEGFAEILRTVLLNGYAREIVLRNLFMFAENRVIKRGVRALLSPESKMVTADVMHPTNLGEELLVEDE